MKNGVPQFGILLLILAALVVASPLPSAAWEEDLHYGLTKWLAIKAGYTPKSAELIAANDQFMDDSSYLNAIGATYDIILKKDAGAAEMVGLHHFPNAAGGPNPPRLRVVLPDGLQARAAVEEAIRDFGLYTQPEGLRRFGLALHTLQDSWAHQGVPDIPFSPFWKPWPDGEWGHPKARGGWYRHNADQTFRYTNDALATAYATYAALCKLLAQHHELSVRQAVPWSVLKPEVEAFARARTKQEKLAWFKGDSEVPFSTYGKCDFLNYISIDDGANWVPQCAARPTQHRWLSLHLPHLRDIWKPAESFLRLWLLRQEIGAAMETVDTKEIQAEFAVLGKGRVNGVEWTRKFLILWLVRDHGLVNDLGHGMPTAKGYAELPTRLEFEGSFRVVRYQSLGQAIVSPLAEEPYSVVSMAPNGDQKRKAVLFSFRRLPHDGLLLIFGKEKTGWRVVRMYWLIG